MTNPLTDLEIRFADVVFAIDTTRKSLRKWLQSGKVELDSDSQEGWRNFSLYDLATLAIMRKLVDFGVSVADAALIARTHVRSVPGGKFTLVMAGGKNMLPDSLMGQTLIVAPAGSGWDTWKSGEYFPLDIWPEVGELDAKLVLNLENIVRRAFERAAERLNQPEQIT